MHTYIQHTWISWEVVFVAQQVFLKDKAWMTIKSTLTGGIEGPCIGLLGPIDSVDWPKLK